MINIRVFGQVFNIRIVFCTAFNNLIFPCGFNDKNSVSVIKTTPSSRVFSFFGAQEKTVITAGA